MATKTKKITRFNPHDLYEVYRGAGRVVRACRFCPHVDVYRTGGGGRGGGFARGNAAAGRLIQHVKECHPAEYRAARETHFALTSI